MLILTGSILFIIGLLIEKNIYSLFSSFWFSSGILLVLLLSLVDQPFFSKDSNIFVNAVTASLSLLLIVNDNRDVVFYCFVIYILYLLFSSLFLMFIRKNPLQEENRFVQFFSRFNRIIGKPDVIFSAFFLWGAIKQYGIGTGKFNSLFWFWVTFTLLNVPELSKAIDQLFMKKKKMKGYGIGEIFGVQSQNTFLVKLNSDCRSVDVFSFVEFKSSVDEKIKKGLICDVMLLDQEQWVKVISNNEIEDLFCQTVSSKDYVSGQVYLVDEIPNCSLLEKFVGIITENSTIETVRFIYNSKVKIYEGCLLETSVNGIKVLYQIVEGVTKIEQLSNKNQSAHIIGEAIQLGTWNNSKCQFEGFGWVPGINTPIYLASDIEKEKINSNEIVLGYLPDTNYPVVMDKEIAITHHMAVIGVTGTGKSVFSRNLIREYLKDENVKIVCIDFTGEYGIKFLDLKPKPVFDDNTAQNLFAAIDYIQDEMDQHYNKDTKGSSAARGKIFETMSKKIEEFLIDGSCNISLFELPEVENTSGVLVYTQYFFRALFKLAKANRCFGKRVCLVIEEAHTIIPEWNFSGISEKASQPLINSISQIALQGRKYNVGLLVIAQRTANVSKTILTQCNSIISFQEYDKTSTEFLANYFGQNIASALSKLKFRQAVAAGKAFRSNVPMIFEVPDIKEKEFL